MERFVQLFECSELKNVSPKGGGISTLEVDERGDRGQWTDVFRTRYGLWPAQVKQV